MTVMIFQGPYDDMIAFAVSAKESGVGVDICNQDTFGYVMTPLSGEGKTLEDDLNILTNIMTEVTIHFLYSCWMMPYAFRLYGIDFQSQITELDVIPCLIRLQI